MKQKSIRILSLASALILTLATFAGCAANDANTDMMAPGEMMSGGNVMYTSKSESISYDYAADAEMGYDDYYAPETTAPSTTGSGNNAPIESSMADSARKLIKNVSLQMETKTFDDAMAAIDAKIAACGGYVQSSSSWGGGIYNENHNRRASMTVRVPAEQLDAFCSGVSEIATVVEKSENTQDVTLAYYDMESHMKALRQEYDTLLGILEKCTELKDVISVQSRITDVLYQIESYKTQLNNYDSLVTYSTVSISLSEVERVTVVPKERTVWERMSDGLSRTFDDMRKELEDFAVSFVVNLPYLIIWAVILGGGTVILVVLCRRSAKKRAARRAAKAAQKPTQTPPAPQNPQG